MARTGHHGFATHHPTLVLRGPVKLGRLIVFWLFVAAFVVAAILVANRYFGVD
jgi:hypothetical protein